MRVEKEYFIAKDGANLFGLLHRSEIVQSKEVVIATHGMGSSGIKPREDKIAKKLTENGIDYFTYNNRGSGIINEVRFPEGKRLQGTAYEDVEDCYYDVLGAIELMREKGYTRIHLQGHSLGSTKTIYTYNKLINENNKEVLSKIKSIILLSLVDITEVMGYLIKTSEQDIVNYALQKEKEGKENQIIVTNIGFMPLVSVKTFLKYYRDNECIDFAKYKAQDFEFKALNNIKIPLFMRWGNVNELISIPADKLANLMNAKIKNDKRDISYIDGATHNYTGKEDCLADEILDFLKNQE